MKYSLLLVICLSFSLIFIACESAEDAGPDPVFNEDISGEYEGRINVSNVGQGIVLYKFERDSSNVFKGYYEGNEFAEVSVTGNFFQGEASNGNTSFATLNGQLSETGISMVGYDADGSSIFSFSGQRIDEGTRQTADVVIAGNEYLIKDETCSLGLLGFTTIHGFERIAGAELISSIYLNFENEPSPGTYNAVSRSTPPSAGTFNGDMSFQGRFVDVIGGSVEVTATNEGYEISLDNVIFEPDSVVNVQIEGSVACGG